MNTNTRSFSSLWRLALVAASQALLLAPAAPAQERQWLDPQIQYFDLGSNAAVNIGYRRLAPDRNLMAVGWSIENKTNQKVEFHLDQIYCCNGRVVQERLGSLVSVKPGQTLRGARFGGDDIILWDDFFYGTRPSDQLRQGEVIDQVRIRVRWKDTAADAAEQQCAEAQRQAAERAEQERREREVAEARRLRDEERRQEARERREREAEQNRREQDRRDRVESATNERVRRIRNETETAQNAVGSVLRGLQERSRREAEERRQEREEERREEAEAEARRERRERRRLGLNE